MKNKTLLGFTIASLAFGLSSLSAAVLIDENFDGYSDGALAGQGPWTRAPNTATSTDNLQVLDGAAYFDWTGRSAAEFQGVRYDWGGDSLVTGSVFAVFDLNVSQAPVDSTDLRPGFFAFVSSNGAQERGQVGLMPGSAPDTFRIGVSSSSQVQSAFTFGSQDLNLNETYQVMVEYQINPGSNTTAQVWLNTTNPLDAPVAVGSAASSAANIRRVNLRMNTTGGAEGISDLGIFTLDNLQVATSPIPEPSHYALLFGAAALGFLGYRRRRS